MIYLKGLNKNKQDTFKLHKKNIFSKYTASFLRCSDPQINTEYFYSIIKSSVIKCCRS